MAYLRSNVPTGSEPLLLNLDETRVWRCPGGKGNVMVSLRRTGRRPLPVRRASLSALRSGVTHVGLIADRPDVQAVLPQVIVHNEHLPTLRALRTVAPDLPANITFVRQNSSWTNIGNLCGIIRRLAAALRPWRGRLQPILLMDCARQHLHWRVAAQAARSGIWLVYIPASMTWLLQPCDTHVFALLKAFMSAGYSELASASRTGEVTEEDWLRLVGRAVRSILQGRRWGDAFAQNGFGRASEIRSEVRAELGPEEVPAVGNTRPSCEDLQAVFPGRSKAHAQLPRHLWRPFDDTAAPPPKASGISGRARFGGPPLAAPLAPPPAESSASSGVEHRPRPCNGRMERVRGAAAATGAGRLASGGIERTPILVKATAAARAVERSPPTLPPAGAGAP